MCCSDRMKNRMVVKLYFFGQECAAQEICWKHKKESVRRVLVRQ